MLRVAGWTGGLFAIGAGVAHYFPGSWTEPLILAVLGATMLLVGGRGGHGATTSGNTAEQSQVPSLVPASKKPA